MVQVAGRKSLGWVVPTATVFIAVAGGIFFTLKLRPYLELASFLLAVAGFLVLWVQVRRARGAAEAARQATQDAFSAMSERVTIADLSRIRARIGHVQEALRSNKFEIALIHMQDLRTELVQLRSRRSFGSDDRQATIQGIVTSLSRYQDTLERRVGDPNVDVHVSKINSRLGDSILILAAWSEEVRFTQEDEDT